MTLLQVDPPPLTVGRRSNAFLLAIHYLLYNHEAMRNITKKEINILLTSRQHSMITRLKETGVNMSSISRLAIRKFGDSYLEHTDDGAKTKRVVIYLEAQDCESLETISAREGLTRSEALRRLIAKYLLENEDALNRLF